MLTVNNYMLIYFGIKLE